MCDSEYLPVNKELRPRLKKPENSDVTRLLKKLSAPCKNIEFKFANILAFCQLNCFLQGALQIYTVVDLVDFR